MYYENLANQLFDKSDLSIEEISPDNNDNSANMSGSSVRETLMDKSNKSPVTNQETTQISGFTIDAMKALLATHDTAKELATASLGSLTLVLNSMDSNPTNNQGQVGACNNGRDFISYMDENYDALVGYYKNGGDFKGNICSNYNE